MSMNIYAQKGDKVSFEHPNAGYPHDQEVAKQYLTLHKEYSIVSTDPQEFRTEVYLHGFPGISFNSVMFDDVKK